MDDIVARYPSSQEHENGSKTAVAPSKGLCRPKAIPDSVYPGMWRVRWPDGRTSDMVNLTRARDAAQAIAERGPPAMNRRLLRWEIKYVEQALGSPVVNAVRVAP